MEGRDRWVQVPGRRQKVDGRREKVDGRLVEVEGRRQKGDGRRYVHAEGRRCVPYLVASSVRHVYRVTRYLYT